MRHLPSCLLLCLCTLTQALPAHAYKLLDGKWVTSDGPIEYTISARGSDDLADDSDEKAVEGAFRSWECVLCSDIQFKFVGDGPNEVNMSDGKNAMFWLETAAEWQSQTGADINSTLGVTFHGGGTYSDSDIAFNGAMHTWSTDEGISATDVESVALHEAGHFVGLAHPCTDASETDCLTADQSVMNPTYPGGNAREPHQDDKDGICAIYPNPKSACSGKKRLKEACAQDCECEDGLLCVPDGAARMCSRRCGEGAAACPKATGCVLGADGLGRAGLCLRNPDPASPKKQDGSVCTRDNECQSGSCSMASVLSKLVCTHTCNDDSMCVDGYKCMDHTCLLPTAGSGAPCPDETPKGCGKHRQAEGGTGWAALVAAVVLWRRARRST